MIIGFVRLALVMGVALSAFGAPVPLDSDACGASANTLDSSLIENGIHVQGGLTLNPTGPFCNGFWLEGRQLDLPAGDYVLRSSLEATVDFAIDACEVEGECLNVFQVTTSIQNTAISSNAGAQFDQGISVLSRVFEVPFTHAGGLLVINQRASFAFNIPEGVTGQATFTFPASAVSQIIGGPDTGTGGGAVPEPSTFGLAGVGCAVLVWRRWRARR